ncbi:MAG: hypothetical protein JWO78_806 [Micavibrio sp.]|nr:hypothetical protein [Micavibrio sp.]
MKFSTSRTPLQSTEHMVKNACDEKVSVDIRLSNLLGICQVIEDSLLQAGYFPGRRGLHVQSLRQNTLPTLSLMARHFATAAYLSKAEWHYLEKRRVNLEWFELTLPVLIQKLSAPRVCAAIPAVAGLAEIAAFAKQERFPGIAEILALRAQSDIKPDLGTKCVKAGIVFHIKPPSSP